MESLANRYVHEPHDHSATAFLITIDNRAEKSNRSITWPCSRDVTHHFFTSKRVLRASGTFSSLRDGILSSSLVDAAAIAPTPRTNTSKAFNLTMHEKQVAVGGTAPKTHDGDMHEKVKQPFASDCFGDCRIAAHMPS